jgi:hypothetical protein
VAKPSFKFPLTVEVLDGLRGDIPPLGPVVPDDPHLARLLYDRSDRMELFDGLDLDDDARAALTLGLDAVRSSLRLLVRLAVLHDPSTKARSEQLSRGVKQLIDAHHEVQKAVLRSVHAKERVRGVPPEGFRLYKLQVRREAAAYKQLVGPPRHPLLDAVGDPAAIVTMGLSGEQPGDKWPAELVAFSESARFLARSLGSTATEDVVTAMERDREAWAHAAAAENADHVELSRVHQQMQRAREAADHLARVQDLLRLIPERWGQDPEDARVREDRMGWALQLAVEQTPLRGLDDEEISLSRRREIAKASDDAIFGPSPP